MPVSSHFIARWKRNSTTFGKSKPPPFSRSLKVVTVTEAGRVWAISAAKNRRIGVQLAKRLLRLSVWRGWRFNAVAICNPFPFTSIALRWFTVEFQLWWSLGRVSINPPPARCMYALIQTVNNWRRQPLSCTFLNAVDGFTFRWRASCDKPTDKRLSHSGHVLCHSLYNDWHSRRAAWKYSEHKCSLLSPLLYK